MKGVLGMRSGIGGEMVIGDLAVFGVWFGFLEFELCFLACIENVTWGFWTIGSVGLLFLEVSIGM